MPKTGPSEKTRREVFERDGGFCQFWHREPVAATEISHMIHQGPGGLPPEHELNQPGNLAASCSECHRRFPPNGRWRWREFEPIGFGVDHVGRRMVIESPSGKVVPKYDLWFYNRWTWVETQARFQELRDAVRIERDAALKSADLLRWIKEHGLPAAVNEHTGYLPLAAELGLSSAETKRRIRVAAAIDGMSVGNVDIRVLDRIRSKTTEELEEIAGWFAELPPAEAWERFRNRFPDEEGGSNYTALELPGDARMARFKAKTTDDAAEELRRRGIEPDLLMRASTVIQRSGKVVEVSEGGEDG